MFILVVRKYCEPGLCSSQQGCNIYSKYEIENELELNKFIEQFTELSNTEEHNYDTFYWKLEKN
jgi:hypothetical protein